MKGLFKRFLRKPEQSKNNTQVLENRFLTGIYGGNGDNTTVETQSETAETNPSFIGIGGVKKPPP